MSSEDSEQSVEFEDETNTSAESSHDEWDPNKKPLKKSSKTRKTKKSNKTNRSSTRSIQEKSIKTKKDEWPWQYNILEEPKIIPFTGKTGISEEIKQKLDKINDKNEGITEYDVFSLILDDDFWNIIVRETNLDANLQLLNKKSASNCVCWVDCTLDEIKTFFALIILMGQIRKPSLNLYWSRRKILSTPFFNEIMPIARFKLISKYIRFSKRDPDNENPLYRLQNIIDLVNKKFESIYIPRKEVSIDESIVNFKGRTTMSHYIPNKRHKRGFKIYKLCESLTAYCSKFLIATKRNEKYNASKNKASTSAQYDSPEDLEETNNILVGESIVSILGESIFNKGYLIYTDNFFTSPNLCRSLLERNTYSIGTTRMDRKNCPMKFRDKEKMKDQDVRHASAHKILALKYQDKKKTVYFLTTYLKQLKWVNIDKGYKKIDRLECVHDYNQHMHGVDRHDQKLASFTIMRRHLKWYRKLFLYLLDMCILNASIVFHEYLQEKKSQFKILQLTQFRFDLVEQILSKVVLVQYKKFAFKKNPLRFNNDRCFLVKLEPTEKKKNPTRKCVYCTSKKRRSETVYRCVYCNVSLHKTCFPMYHSNQTK